MLFPYLFDNMSLGTGAIQYILFRNIFLTILHFLQGEPDACQTCRDGMMKLYESGLKEESIQEQKDLLIKDICPFVPDPLGCKTGVETWWDTLAERMFNEEAAKRVCNALNGQCEVIRYII